MSGSRPVVGTAEALAGLLEFVAAVGQHECMNLRAGYSACGNSKTPCTYCRARRALAAWRERKPLREDHTLRDVARSHLDVDYPESGVDELLDLIELHAIGSPAPQGGRRG